MPFQRGLFSFLCSSMMAAHLLCQQLFRARAGYNWEEMEKDGYLWWRRRLRHMAQYFSAYRVDHVLGFFRVFEVPERHVTGTLGHFCPSHPLKRSALEQLGLWDLERLCKPWITADILREVVGEKDVEEVLAKYLEPTASGYRFRKAWSSERALSAISAPADVPAWLSDVCLRACLLLCCHGSPPQA
jgi:4-alpha-glucanotransferase